MYICAPTLSRVHIRYIFCIPIYLQYQMSMFNSSTPPVTFLLCPFSPISPFMARAELLFLLVSLSVFSRCRSYASTEKEKTLAMIKPDGLNYTNDIKRVLVESGFSILREKTIELNEGDARLFYAEHSERSFFPNLIKYMTSGPVFVMVLEKANAITGWRALIGPTDARKAKITHPQSIRAMCGFDSERNCVHGSDSPESATREISFFFKEIASTEGRLPGRDEL